jgi:adenosylcobinamide-GDP ribazoletransferase
LRASIFSALQHFTRIRPGDGVDAAPSGHTLRGWPIAGLIVALAQSLVFALASVALPHPVAILLAIAAGLMLTGAHHEAGWMSWCGRNGIVGVIVLILLRFETLAQIDADWLVAALLCAAAFSRACSVLLIASLPASFAASGETPLQASGRESGVALLVGAIPVLGLIAWTGDLLAGVLAMASAIIATAVIRGLSLRRRTAQRMTILDAAQQVAEVAFFLGLLVALGLTDIDASTEDEGS